VLRALSGALGGVAIIYGNAELPMQADPEARIEGLADHAERDAFGLSRFWVPAQMMV
jgi:hypothetical protein